MSTYPEESWSLIRQTTQDFAPHYTEGIQAAFAAHNFQGEDWFFTFMAYGLDPKPLTADFFHHLHPYSNIETAKERLAQVSERGFLQAIEPHTYQLTAAGHATLADFYQAADQALSLVSPLPANEMNRLVTLLGRIVDATLAAPEPPDKPQLQISRRSQPGADAAAATHIDQYLTDLIYYRDDAHLAAWRDLDVSGPVWETLTFIWQNEANTAVALAERLANRGYDADVYTAACQELVQRGWIEEKDGVYQTTDRGQALRDEAEETTNRFFYVGWSALTASEVAELIHLLTNLQDGLTALTAAQEAAATS